MLFRSTPGAVPRSTPGASASPPSTPGASAFAFLASTPPEERPAAPRSTPPSSFAVLPSTSPEVPAGSPGRVVAIGGGGQRAPHPQAQPGRVVALGRSPEPPGRVVASAADPVEPVFAVSATKSATWMEVRWLTAAAFARDISMQLANYVLVLRRGAEPFPEREPIRCMLRFEEIALEFPAGVLAIGPELATYRVQIDALQMEQLKLWERAWLKRR